MLPKITVIGKYTGTDKHGTLIGGKEFKPGKVLEIQVDEDTYNRLVLANENGWFEIKESNFHDWLVSRGRHADSFAKPAEKKTWTEPTVVEAPAPAPIVEAPVVEAPQTIEEAREVLEQVAEAIIEANPEVQGLEEKLEGAMDEAIETVAGKKRR